MEKMFKSISLNGCWEMNFYGGEEYLSDVEPSFEGCKMADAVPAYWEDMIDSFGETFIYEHLKWNPSYAPQKYPIAGYVPDMALPNILGCFFYRRSFVIEDLDKNLIYRINCLGAQNTVSVWINGKYLGIHRGYSAPFSLSVPSGVLTEGENVITLAVSNLRLAGYKDRPVSGCTSRAANDCTGGIYGDLELRAYLPKSFDFYANVSEDLSSIVITAKSDSPTELIAELNDGSETVREAKFNENGTASIPTAGLRLWSPDDPFRYTIRVYDSEKYSERPFGIRRLSAKGISLYLNGNPIYARGICEHSYFPLTVHPTRDKKYYRKAIKTLKSLGFNLIRFHTSVPMPEYIEAADELGMLMEIESPNNTTLEEWREIVDYTSKYTAPVIYSTGNEMIIDEDYIEHLRAVADEVHTKTDSLFSPMSAMRGIEYYDYGNDRVDEPFSHNPVRLAALSEFCDLYNSYPNGQLSYISASADPCYVDKCNAVYKKPILSHEICINGTYCDLSLAQRYEGTRIGETALYSSVKAHLEKKGLIDRAPLYYRNSSEWQRRLRKQCFESARRCNTLSGYDYLGDIDHHWHTFGYCVGMMNEFYELKPGETNENVLRYNSDAVLLCDLPYNVNFEEGRRITFPILISNYSDEIDRAELTLRLISDREVVYKKKVGVSSIPAGCLTPLHSFSLVLPKIGTPRAYTLSLELEGDGFVIENRWEIYSFPHVSTQPPSRAALKEASLIILDENATEKDLVSNLTKGKSVLLFGKGPFATLKTSFQIALAGRTAGHLATVISDSPLMEKFPHSGFCSWQFRAMLDGGCSVLLDLAPVPFDPIVEAVSTYKYAHREAVIFEYKVGEGRLLVCTLGMSDEDPGAAYLKKLLIDYAMSSDFAPKNEISFAELEALFGTNPVYEAENTNMARNTNDITA